MKVVRRDMVAKPSDRDVKSYGSVSIALWISSRELTPEAVTKAIGIDPTRVRHRGDLTLTGIKRRDEFDVHEWMIKEKVLVADVEEVNQKAEQLISDFLSKLSSHAAGIRAFADDHNVLITIIYSLPFLPYVGLTRQHLRNIALLGARLDYDLLIDGY